eukprot:3571206-Pyramimonas_sp.AAC.1
MLALDSKRYLVVTAASNDTWSEVMDQVYLHDKQSAATRLKWKPSRNGGRVEATPSATATMLNAERRLGNKANRISEQIAEIVVKGELGKDDAV